MENTPEEPLSPTDMWWVDTEWYLKTYPDVERAKVDPRVHYERYGAKEGRNPNAFFDAAWYKREHSLPSEADVGLHHQRQWEKGCDTEPCFDFVRCVRALQESGRMDREPDGEDTLWHVMESPHRMATLASFIGKSPLPFEPIFVARRRPLRGIKADAAQPQRLNVICPELSPALSAGPMSILRFALEMMRRGIRVRMLFIFNGGERTFESLVHRDALARSIFIAAGMQAGDEAMPEVSGSDDPLLACNPRDRFVATLYATAFSAHASQALLNDEPFIYFIQDAEDIFFPSGAEECDARESYTLPHRAMFSTDFLRNHFQSRGVGVFASARGDPEATLAVRENNTTSHLPAVRIDWTERVGGTRCLVFYARPTVDRNAYNLAVAALWHASTEGAFRAHEWNIVGVGSHCEYDIELPGGRVCRVLPHLEEAQYRDLIARSDVGLSLMMSPHPSMPPIDFAAAGMISVTNVYEGKSAEALSQISPNIEPCDPTLRGIVDALNRACARCSDMRAREKGCNVAWATRWSDERCYGDGTAETLRRWMA